MEGCLEVRKDEYQTQILNSSFKIPSFFADFSVATSAPSSTVPTPPPKVATHKAEYLNSWMITLLVAILHSSIGLEKKHKTRKFQVMASSCWPVRFGIYWRSNPKLPLYKNMYREDTRTGNGLIFSWMAQRVKRKRMWVPESTSKRVPVTENPLLRNWTEALEFIRTVT